MQNITTELVLSRRLYMTDALAKGALTLSKQAQVFTCLQCKPFENTVGKVSKISNEVERIDNFRALATQMIC